MQVLDEVQGPSITRSYVYGLELIEQDRINTSTLRQGTSYNVYDGHGSVRALTDLTGAVTDTYDYDAFGNLIHSTGTTPNSYLFAGEQFDPDLHLYYNRARYLNASTGRFWSMDTFEGSLGLPLSLHKYLYSSGDPINRVDPSGNLDTLVEEAAEESAEIAISIQTTLTPAAAATATTVAESVVAAYELNGALIGAILLATQLGGDNQPAPGPKTNAEK